MSELLPTIDIVIPALNAAGALSSCLSSIRAQDYPSDRVRVIVADGGSTDATRVVAARFGAVVVDNPERFSEVGKALGLRTASAELVAFIDSDNILPHEQWLRRMVVPFADSTIVASEPIRFTYRRTDGFITRYCALLGMNDPLNLFLGTYDRESLLTGRWTGLTVEETHRPGYRRITLSPGRLPTIGANGTLFRRAVLRNVLGSMPALYDVDVLPRLLAVHGVVHIAKVDVGIVHLYADSIRMFVRKQHRRVRDYLYFRTRGTRQYPQVHSMVPGIARFIAACVTVVPLLVQSWRGYRRVRDPAWWFHPLACLLTLGLYTAGTLRSLLGPAPASRAAWRQVVASVP